jgi:tetratricopeptide (TPR) repeat protein
MAKLKPADRIEDLLQSGEWAAARSLLERERDKSPDDHRILTQLGTTFYELEEYEEALPLFLASLKLGACCPLTLWNLAGTLDALGKHREAAGIYTWLLECELSPDADPCWEAGEWADALKTDCVYRLADCLRQQGLEKAAEHCFRQYVELFLLGIDGSYPVEDALCQIRDLHGASRAGADGAELRNALKSTLRAAGGEPGKRRRNGPPTFDETALLAGHRAAARG